jgi:hypothetical protein
LLLGDAARRTALRFAESADVEIELPDDSAEGVAVHSQHWRGLAEFCGGFRS